MQSQAKLKHHAALVDQMAEVQGIDLEEHMLRGNLSFMELEDAVFRCTGCTQPEACQSWLNEHAPTASTPPGYCRNSALFDALKPR